MEKKNTFGYNVPFPSKLRKHIYSRKASVSPQVSQTAFWGFPLGEQRNTVGGVIAWCSMVSPRHSADWLFRQTIAVPCWHSLGQPFNKGQWALVCLSTLEPSQTKSLGAYSNYMQSLDFTLQSKLEENFVFRVPATIKIRLSLKGRVCTKNSNKTFGLCFSYKKCASNFPLNLTILLFDWQNFKQISI